MNNEAKQLHNRANRRYRRKIRLEQRGKKLLERLYRYPPKNMTESELKLAHVRIASAIYLPYNWSDSQYRRAEVSLKNMEEKYFDKRYAKYSPEFEALLAKLWQDLDMSPATVTEQAQAVAELMFTVSARLENEYGDGQPPLPQSLLYALACERNTHPAWVIDAIVEMLTRKFSAQESIQISNKLYEALSHPAP